MKMMEETWIWKMWDLEVGEGSCVTATEIHEMCKESKYTISIALSPKVT